MAEFILKLIMEYGVLPAMAVYLVYTIANEYKHELRDLRSEVEKTTHTVTDAMVRQNEAMIKLASAVTKLQGVITTQVNTILIRFIDLTSTKDGDKDA